MGTKRRMFMLSGGLALGAGVGVAFGSIAAGAAVGLGLGAILAFAIDMFITTRGKA